MLEPPIWGMLRKLASPILIAFFIIEDNLFSYRFW